MFRISEFATLAGTTPKVLRDHDRASLFRPAWVDATTGYRGYTASQLPALRRILALRDLGVSVADLRRLVAEQADLASVLEQRRVALEQARLETDRRLAAVGIELDGRIPGLADVVVRALRPELVGVLDVVGEDDAPAFHALEAAIRDAGVRASRPPMSLVDGLGGGVAASIQVGVPVTRPVPTAFASVRLPAVRAATVLHRGSYASLDATRRALLEWMASTGLVPAGSLRVLYLQFGAEADLRLPSRYLVDRAADLVTELQVPLS